MRIYRHTWDNCDGLVPFSRATIYSGANSAVIKTFPPATDGNIAKVWPIGDQNGDGMDEIAVFSSSANSALGNSMNDFEIRIYTSGIKPIEFYTSNSGTTPALSLNWIPEAGHIHDSVGELRIAGASPGAQGVVLASLAPADIPVFGTDLLVAVDATNLSLLATLSANTAGVFAISDITRRAPAIAGTSIHVQVYETSPAIRASRGIRFTAIP